MTQEEKSLLLKDLCGRLPYGIICHANEINVDGELIFVNKLYNIAVLYYDNTIGKFEHCPINDIKPYLRPMSSMTEEEKHKLLKFGAITCLENGEVIDVSCVGFERHADVQDYLNTCHFDYRGLIPMGLALEAKEGMYNSNEK